MPTLKRLKLLAATLLCISALGLIGRAAAAQPVEGGKFQTTFDVREFGAVGDGVTFDTAAIQAAIDACSRVNGGRVLLQNGIYLTRTIRLKSNVTLYLEAGAVLLGSTKLADYETIHPEYKCYTYSYQSLIHAEKADNVSILGKGTIDLQGRSWPEQSKGAAGQMEWGQSPYAVQLVQCRNLTIRDVTIRNCPMVALRIVAGDNVLVDGAVIDNRVRISCDGIELVSCQRATVSNCRVNSWDDGICLKSASFDPCRNITITNCTVSSLCNAIKLGTESTGGFQNITISNCTIETKAGMEGMGGRGTDMVLGGKLGGISGLSLEIVDGGTMDGVNVSNLVMKNVRTPIFIRLGNRGRLFTPDQPKPGIGILRNVQISNIQAEVTDAKYACSITGEPGYPVEKVVLSNMRLRFPGGANRAEADRKVPELPADYPEALMYGPLPAYGFYCRYVDKIEFRDVILETEKADDRPAFIFQDASNLEIAHLSATSGAGMPALLVMNQVQQATIQRSAVHAPLGTYLKITGSGSKDILLWQNDLRMVSQAVSLEDGVPTTAVTQSGNLNP